MACVVSSADRVAGPDGGEVHGRPGDPAKERVALRADILFAVVVVAVEVVMAVVVVAVAREGSGRKVHAVYVK